ncbi:uncharacterized protein LOC122949709 [Acropora millepora]|uniref:uncharacterized protein LOC122949709 n=1 Tax=Acropora millepora TaxID=45264 RepID=UPI001CF56177|nr:uncharacterized protein LOC122949709 [Acropora millepora]
MEDGLHDLFVFLDDFEAILDILEEDERISEHFETAVRDVHSQVIVCSDSKETYKTRGGFERHRSSKHGQQVKVKLLILTEEIHREIVDSVAAMLSMREKKLLSKLEK